VHSISELTMKKGSLEFEQIVKLIVALLFIAFVIAMMILLKGKEIGLIDKIKDFITYG